MNPASRLHFLSLKWIWPLMTLLVFPLTAPAVGNLTQYNSHLWQVENGLPHDVVLSLAQTRDGYLWVGTQEGLVRFDGVRFQPLPFPELAHAPITALCESRDGTLWIGTEKGLFALSKGKLSCYTQTEGLPRGGV